MPNLDQIRLGLSIPFLRGFFSTLLGGVPRNSEIISIGCGPGLPSSTASDPPLA
jgi:hypothetical protein